MNARAHPRSRGEHEEQAAFSTYEVGSSPLARGTRVSRAGVGWLGGLIPARAGNTLLKASQSKTFLAHPRSRGEHILALDITDYPTGSSPLARGTLRPVARDTCTVGLIPARAGNTVNRNGSLAPFRAHPRSRGEHQAGRLGNTLDLGSSPLARGTLFMDFYISVSWGLIPARAGNTTEG